jgi:predicted transposase YbfD/YdcC
VKKNQKTLLNQIQHGSSIQKPDAIFESGWEKHHGRLEHRKYESFSALPMLKKWQDDWSAITQVVRVTRYRERLNSKEKRSEETSFYVLNRTLPIEDIQAIRNHWHIENKLHYVKDVAFREDKSIKRVNPAIFSTCIDFALNRLRSYGRPFKFESFH